MSFPPRFPLLIATTALLGASAANAQGPEPEDLGGVEHDPTELAKKTQNPVSDLISVPLQFNFLSGGDLGDQSIVNLNIQPVVPISVTPSWNVIARAIVPVFNLPEPRGMRETGLGDIEIELFASPSSHSTFTWGVGPIFSIPTATLPATETGSWGIGPAAVVVWMPGRWVIGALATQTWTFADYGDDRDVNQLLVQPFVNYNLGRGWALTSAPIITAKWDRPSGDELTFPIGGGISWTTKIGGQHMNIGAQYYYNLEKPDGAEDNQLRFVMSFLFPRTPPPPSEAVSSATP